MKKEWKVYILIAVVVFAAPALGMLGGSGDSEWYRSLVRPDIAPPSWVFGPVWTTLYTLLAISTALAWRDAKKAMKPEVLRAFGVNIIFNAIWSPVFFGAQNIGPAFFLILLVLASTGYLVFTYGRIKPLYGWMNVPYFVWVSFATVLNFQFWMINY